MPCVGGLNDSAQTGWLGFFRGDARQRHDRCATARSDRRARWNAFIQIPSSVALVEFLRPMRLDLIFDSGQIKVLAQQWAVLRTARSGPDRTSVRNMAKFVLSKSKHFPIRCTILQPMEST